MADTMQLFTWTIIIQLFYAVSITMIVHAMPTDNFDTVTIFEEPANNMDMATIRDSVNENLQSQSKIPLVEAGALVFYSGNILLDLILNFVFAIPQIFFLLMKSFLLLFNMPEFITAQLEIFISVIITVLYFISIIQMLLSVRSGRTLT